ncbi:MAG: alpha-glucan family phosphorylase [Candidatus Omnitrophica bacterium]|nr:alpha-glucan family phosphorylase [Candidatus Omnitrophota bacterium]MDD5351966.1 alpha-glucan family phosphorylase [Candidatus Omnitrophota bacterium]MDD5550792.1 alpha-glucan family phosphorylase [Candidatus Omnitrophota bacterium]
MASKLEEFISLVDVHEFGEKYSKNIDNERYFGFPLDSIIEAERKLRSAENKSIAYISMEYGLATSFYNTFKSSDGVGEKNRVINHQIFSNMRIEDYLFDFQIDKILDLPIYSGGLGVLAGDTLKSAADLGIPLVAIGILWEKGYFKQNFWFKYGQVPEEMNWDPHNYPGLIPLKNIIKIKFKKDTVHLRLWKYYVFSHDKKNVIPLILLDSNIEENSEEIKRLTDQLYKSSDNWTKIMQRSILGIGAIKTLDELGYKVDRYHLNEGHAAMAFVEKAKELDGKQLSNLRKKFIYTCHTPVSAGHDRFTTKDFEKILPTPEFSFLDKFGREDGNGLINLTLLLLSNCEKINSVSKKHRYVTHSQFPQFKDKITSITNGVHIHTWLSDNILELFDKYNNTLGDYRKDPLVLKNILALKNDEKFRKDLWIAHQKNKKRLADIFSHWHIKENIFTVCWAKRMAQYKRPSLILHDPQRLLSIAKNAGQLQIIIAGKAHPADSLAGTYIDDMMNTIDELSSEFKNLRIIMLENYDIFFGKLLTSCVDVWLNNPLPPFEASGTSGMKAILNGVVQLTTLDGWVVEANNKQMGEIFGYHHNQGDPIGSESDLRLKEDSEKLYDSLERLVSLYYQTYNDGNINFNSQWIDLMINCIAESHYFNSHRMVKEYQEKMWQA